MVFFVCVCFVCLLGFTFSFACFVSGVIGLLWFPFLCVCVLEEFFSCVGFFICLVLFGFFVRFGCLCFCSVVW